jgi:hypothetical protein
MRLAPVNLQGQAELPIVLMLQVQSMQMSALLLSHPQLKYSRAGRRLASGS